MVKVAVLKEGYAHIDENGWMRANASCVLVQSPQNTVIVDTLTPWDGPFILQKLQEMDVSPGDISYVVSTHGHSDHNGSNNLFLEAKQHIVGYCISKGDQYYAHPFEQDEPYIIDPFLKIIPTPGHTNEDVSLVVQTENGKTLVVAGDLFESEKDILNPDIWTGNSFQPDVQVKNRLKVLKIADTIIPGHGPMFEVTKEHVQAAEKLAKSYEDATRDKAS